jgi:hypothetical protein
MWLLLWILCGIAAAMIAAKKGRAGQGLVLGFLLGPFGILFALLMSGNRSQCPACKSMIPEATICPYCRSALESLPLDQDESHPDPDESRGTFQDHIDQTKKKKK